LNTLGIDREYRVSPLYFASSTEPFSFNLPVLTCGGIMTTEELELPAEEVEEPEEDEEEEEEEEEELFEDDEDEETEDEEDSEETEETEETEGS
jgi:hypothetical protein